MTEDQPGGRRRPLPPLLPPESVPVQLAERLDMNALHRVLDQAGRAPATLAPSIDQAAAEAVLRACEVQATDIEHAASAVINMARDIELQMQQVAAALRLQGRRTSEALTAFGEMASAVTEAAQDHLARVRQLQKARGNGDGNPTGAADA